MALAWPKVLASTLIKPKPMPKPKPKPKPLARMAPAASRYREENLVL